MDIDSFLTFLAIFCSFFSVLWGLAQRDRRRIIRILKLLQTILESQANGDGENTKKGGDTL